MGHVSALHIAGIKAGRDARSWLYRADHPRRIDRHIDFFGGGAPRGETSDHRDELLLECRA